MRRAPIRCCSPGFLQKEIRGVGPNMRRCHFHEDLEIHDAINDVGDGLPGWAYRTRTGESVRELPDWICVTTSTRAGARVGGDPSRASCVIRVCSSREDFGRRLFNKKSGRHREHRVASGRVIGLQSARTGTILHSTSVVNGAIHTIISGRSPCCLPPKAFHLA